MARVEFLPRSYGYAKRCVPCWTSCDHCKDKAGQAHMSAHKGVEHSARTVQAHVVRSRLIHASFPAAQLRAHSLRAGSSGIGRQVLGPLLSRACEVAHVMLGFAAGALHHAGCLSHA
jgi:hypothetical protein